MAQERKILVFGNKLALKDTDKEGGKIVRHINLVKSLNAPKFGIMANDKNANALEIKEDPGNGDKRVIDNFQK